MNKILCSTGALIGRPNGRDYRRLSEYASKLECDGFEFMVYGSWYPEFDELLKTISSMKLYIPVIHCHKALGETLCGMTADFDNGVYHEHIMDEEEDRECFKAGLEDFKLNLRAANAFGADRMVLHLWNGIASDKKLDKNIERFGQLNDMAKQAGVELMVENVICNTYNPLSNVARVHAVYPEATYVYDTKMAEFHGQTMDAFKPEYEWLFKDHLVHHLHINDYSGGIMDWSNMNVLPIGKGHVNFDAFFGKMSEYGYNGDYTVEATAFDRSSGVIDYEMLNKCFADLRGLIEKSGVK